MNTIVFFVIAVALALIVLAMLLPPLFGRGLRVGTDRTAQNLAIARERLRDLKNAVDVGDLSAAEYEMEREELERNLADDLEPVADKTAAEPAPRGHWAGVIVSVSVPLLAGALYLGLGRPASVTGAPSPSPNLAAEGQHPTSVEQMAMDLSARLQNNPNDARGWSILGRTYMAMKRYRDAAQALAKLRELVGDDPNVLVVYADALAMVHGGRLAGEPLKLVQLALRKDPNLIQGLWMAGMAAKQDNDLQTALDYWRKAEPMLSQDSKSQAELRGLIADAEQRLGGPTTAGPVAEAPPAPAPAPVAAVDSSSITVQVSLDNSLNGRVAPTDTVFIFARALSGPPMPLAVVRKQVADLPITVTLNDSDAMMPAMSLSKFKQVKVGARISKTGNAVPQSGDFKGEVSPVSTGHEQRVDVLISQSVP